MGGSPISLGLVSAVAVLAVAGGYALTGPAEAAEARSSKASRWGAEPSPLKVSSRLLRARELARSGATALQIRDELPLVRVRDDLVDIDIRLRRLTPQTLSRLETIGVEVTHSSERWARVRGWSRLELLDEIAAVPTVTVIHPSYGARTRTGSVTSQGDISIAAAAARLDFGVDGTDVQVGVMSDSFHVTAEVLGDGTVTGSGCSRVLSGSNPQDTGDLPTQVVVLDNCDSGTGCLEGHSDEGAVLAEVVHDLAPDAAILFHTAFRSQADFAEGIGELIDCGADVVVDDVIYFAEPMFQDGVIASAAQDAADAGVAYFSAAGNEADFGVDETFVDADPGNDANETDDVFPTDGVDLNDFPGGDRFAAIRVPDGCGLRLVLQWNEPFSGTLGPGSSRDLDLYLCSSNSLDLNGDNPPALAGCDFSASGALEASTDAQGCATPGFPPEGDPFEIVFWENDTGAPVTGYVAVDHYCGNQSDVRFRIVAFNEGAGCSLGTAVRQADCSQVDAGEEDLYCFESGIYDQAQIYGHPAAQGASALAAVFYGEIDGGGAHEPPAGQIDVTPNSSAGGPLPFYFDRQGNPLPGAPVTRDKPDLAGPEGVNNTFFGIDIEPDGFPNFLGTSAAVPHAAAVAALMIDRDPTLTPAEMRSLLGSTATDIESAGPDLWSGDGLIDAHGAVMSTPQVPVLVATPSPVDFGYVEVGDSAAAEVRLANPGSADLLVTTMTLSDTMTFSLDVNGGSSPCLSTSPTVGADGACTLEVIFSPSDMQHDEFLVVASNSATGSPESLPLTGRGFTQCTAEDHVELPEPPLPIDGIVTEQACISLAAGAYEVGPSGIVTFIAGERIELRDGFTVEGTFSAVIDGLLVPPP